MSNSNSGLEEARGNGLGGNNGERQGDSSPVKSWKTLFSVHAKTNGPLQFSRSHRSKGKFVVKPPAEVVVEGIDMWKGWGVWLDNSWINDFHFRWCALWLTNYGARRRCWIYPRLRMDYIFLDSGIRMHGLGLWNLDHGILLGDLSFCVHGS